MSARVSAQSLRRWLREPVSICINRKQQKTFPSPRQCGTKRRKKNDDKSTVFLFVASLILVTGCAVSEGDEPDRLLFCVWAWGIQPGALLLFPLGFRSSLHDVSPITKKSSSRGRTRTPSQLIPIHPSVLLSGRYITWKHPIP